MKQENERVMASTQRSPAPYQFLAFSQEETPGTEVTGMSGSCVPLRSSLTARGGEPRGPRGEDAYLRRDGIEANHFGASSHIPETHWRSPRRVSQRVPERLSRHNTGDVLCRGALVNNEHDFYPKHKKQKTSKSPRSSKGWPESNVSCPHLQFHPTLWAIKPLLFPLVPSYPVTLHLHCGIIQFWKRRMLTYHSLCLQVNPSTSAHLSFSGFYWIPLLSHSLHFEKNVMVATLLSHLCLGPRWVIECHVELALWEGWDNQRGIEHIVPTFTHSLRISFACHCAIWFFVCD